MTEAASLTTNAAETTAPLRCWSCGGPVASGALFCGTCRAVQPPGDADHFARLGLAREFPLDVAELDRRYFAAQRQLHPDRFATRSPRERAISQSQAVSLNEAYETLKAPLARACYLLKLEGVARTPDQDHTIDDPALLMDQMERREALGEAADDAAVQRIADAAEADARDALAAIARAFARRDLAAAAREATRLRYLQKLLDDARGVRMRLGQRQAAG